MLFKEELNSDTGDIIVWINSPGGDCIAASQIYNMLMDYKGNVTVKIDGIAASAASVIAMAGTEVQISPTGLMMIHNPLTILYGEPTGEALFMEAQGKIKLGGCLITDTNPEYYCNDCENEWNKREAIDKVYGDIRGIKASVGGYFQGYYEIDIDFNSRKLSWNFSLDPEDSSYSKTIGDECTLTGHAMSVFEQNNFIFLLRTDIDIPKPPIKALDI